MIRPFAFILLLLIFDSNFLKAAADDEQKNWKKAVKLLLMI